MDGRLRRLDTLRTSEKQSLHTAGRDPPLRSTIQCCVASQLGLLVGAGRRGCSSGRRRPLLLIPPDGGS